MSISNDGSNHTKYRNRKKLNARRPLFSDVWHFMPEYYSSIIAHEVCQGQPATRRSREATETVFVGQGDPTQREEA